MIKFEVVFIGSFTIAVLAFIVSLTVTDTPTKRIQPGKPLTFQSAVNTIVEVGSDPCFIYILVSHCCSGIFRVFDRLMSV